MRWELMAITNYTENGIVRTSYTLPFAVDKWGITDRLDVCEGVMVRRISILERFKCYHILIYMETNKIKFTCQMKMPFPAGDTDIKKYENKLKSAMMCIQRMYGYEVGIGERGISKDADVVRVVSTITAGVALAADECIEYFKAVNTEISNGHTELIYAYPLTKPFGTDADIRRHRNTRFSLELKAGEHK